MMNSLQTRSFINKYVPPLIVLALIQLIPFMGLYEEPSATLYTSLISCYAFTCVAYGNASNKVFRASYYVLLGAVSFISTAWGLRSLVYLSDTEIFTMAAFAPVIGHVMLHACRVHEFMTITSETVCSGMGLGDDQLNVSTCLKIGYGENSRLAFTLCIASLLLLILAPVMGVMVSLTIALCILALVSIMCGFIAADIKQMLRVQWVYATPYVWGAVSALVVQLIVVALAGLEALAGNYNAILALPAVTAIAATGLIVIHTATVRK